MSQAYTRMHTGKAKVREEDQVIYEGAEPWLMEKSLSHDTCKKNRQEISALHKGLGTKEEVR